MHDCHPGQHVGRLPALCPHHAVADFNAHPHILQILRDLGIEIDREQIVDRLLIRLVDQQVFRGVAVQHQMDVELSRRHPLLAVSLDQATRVIQALVDARRRFGRMDVVYDLEMRTRIDLKHLPRPQ